MPLSTLHHPLSIIHSVMRSPSSAPRHQLSIIHFPLYTLYSSSTLHHPLSVIHTIIHSQSLSSTLHHPLFVIHHSLSIIHSLSSKLHYPLSIIHSSSSTLQSLSIIHSPSSTVHENFTIVTIPTSSIFLFQVSVGCVIVDPSSNRIVAQSSDMRHVRPLNHAVMSCIDAVAKPQCCESNNHCPGETTSFGLFFGLWYFLGMDYL